MHTYIYSLTCLTYVLYDDPFFLFSWHKFWLFGDVLRQALPSKTPLPRPSVEEMRSAVLCETYIKTSVFDDHLVTLALCFADNVGLSTNLMILMAITSVWRERVIDG